MEDLSIAELKRINNYDEMSADDRRGFKEWLEKRSWEMQCRKRSAQIEEDHPNAETLPKFFGD